MCVHRRQPSAFLSTNGGGDLSRSGAGDHYRHTATGFDGNRQLVPPAAWAGDGHCDGRNLARRRCDDDGRQLHYRARRMAYSLSGLGRPDDRDRYPARADVNQDPAARRPEAGRRRASRSAAGAGRPPGAALALFLDDHSSPVLLRHRCLRHGRSSDQLPDRNRLRRDLRRGF